MEKLLIVGAGRIGRLIALLLSKASYEVRLVDLHPVADVANDTLDITNHRAMAAYITQHGITAVISCLPYFLTAQVAEIAKHHQLHYFDLTEDIQAHNAIKAFAQGNKKAFVPHCGLAPGLSGIVAYDLFKRFSHPEAIYVRVGGLPQYVQNSLHYAITWSLDGLMNQYGNPCQIISSGEVVTVKPLADQEEIEIDGKLYEAFNTSGGLGNLIELCQGKIQELNYKTIRYPGHAEKMRFLMQDLGLNEDRDTLKKILHHALPVTEQDVVILQVTVAGKQDGNKREETWLKKFYPREFAGKTWSALQMTTAASMCAVIDTVLRDQKNYHGFIYQETIPWKMIEQGVFGEYLK